MERPGVFPAAARHRPEATGTRRGGGAALILRHIFLDVFFFDAHQIFAWQRGVEFPAYVERLLNTPVFIFALIEELLFKRFAKLQIAFVRRR
jgi:hypothetical protein